MMRPESHRTTEQGPPWVRRASALAAPVTAACCVAGFVAWLATGSAGSSPPAGLDPEEPVVPEGGAETTPAGRVAPTCILPVSWRLAAVDPRFRLDEEDARGAILEAAERWERAAGRDLFVEAPQGGLPIRFVYDERQERAARLRAIEASFAERDRALEERRRALAARTARVGEGSDGVAERTRTFEAELAAHQRRVRAWQDEGAPPGTAAEELLAAEQALAARRDALDAERARLREERDAVLAETDALAKALEERNREADLLERDHPAARVESAVYRTSVGQAPDGRAVLSAEIRVFVVSGAEDLVVALAHELGHAMGLGHAPGAGAIMSAEHDRLRPAAAVREPGSADVELLRATCGDDA